MPAYLAALAGMYGCRFIIIFDDMKHLFLVVLILAGRGSFLLQAQQVVYTLEWADEFNKDGPPDANNWTAETGLLRNHEAQWYQLRNAYCKDGYLVIEAKREQKENPNYEEGSKDWRKSRKTISYTSSCITTKGKRQWLYGRFEMRARIDIRKGCGLRGGPWV